METLKNLSILVVEDNKVNQILVQDIVSRWTPENEICFADNGTQALERFHQKRFDIIFMDIKLPDKDGFELTTYLRNIHSPNIETPVVGLSAHAMKEYIDKSLHVGMNDFLTKPFAAKDFFAILAKHTGAAHKKITENKQGIDGFKHINLSILKPIYDAKPERMKQIISLYVENISSALENLKLFADTPADPEDVRKIAHNLKSSLRYLGMNEAGEIAYTIEKNPTENLAENLEQIKQFWKFAKAELESILF
jgi:CheY-like chemotaxis protein/HPt (histidine-containing phosphotransfer) domain-containing protein